MFKKLIGFTALAGVIALGSGMGCSVTTVTSDGGTDTDAAPTATGTGTGTVKPPPKEAGPISCYTADEAITGFIYAAPKAGQGVCTPAEINNIIDNCFGSGGDATRCKAATDAAKACDNCITGPATEAEARVAPFPAFVTIDDTGNGYIGIAVCAGLVLNKADCGPKVLTAASCLATACGSCETAGEEACETEAAADACKDAIAAVGTCNKDLTDGAATTDPTCRDTAAGAAGSIGSLKKVATYLCGGPSAGDAGRD